jgi:predicted glycosyltransferase
MRRERSASRYLFYAHDGMGLGHLRRDLAIAYALNELDPWRGSAERRGTCGC